MSGAPESYKDWYVLKPEVIESLGCCARSYRSGPLQVPGGNHLVKKCAHLLLNLVQGLEQSNARHWRGPIQVLEHIAEGVEVKASPQASVEDPLEHLQLPCLRKVEVRHRRHHRLSPLRGDAEATAHVGPNLLCVTVRLTAA
eukprot:7771186-Pyramimonas_sp.AAC.1